METTLVLSRGGLPPMSARGCIQELTPITQGQFKRTVNGDLIFMGMQGKKYKTTISCQDTTVLATDGLIPGAIIEVSCIQVLWQKVVGGKAALERPPVLGSITVVDENKNPVQLIRCEEGNIEVATTEIAYVCYRPILAMRIISYTLKTNEWGVKSGWSLELEEV
ncbi:hypothetical protein [Candidatus Paracaedibacter symbiosus]|uniref:hypothetical protein n=1 Tax=Candidatus Paracaedibacter symbiosus TaxID=244582 RepID=UPI000509C09E|nr:hypothetical protein [Candidatus Paracaedibacter symbiosus]